MKTIITNKAPAAVGPYSQAIEANGFIYCSGQIGIDPATGQLVDGLENQTQQILKNLSSVLDAAGGNLQGIVKTTIYLTNIQDYPKVNVIYGSYFTDTKPARSTVAVSNLPKGALIEIEAVALSVN